MYKTKKLLTKDDILTAQSRTKSNAAAARFLNVSYPTYKKYAKQYIVHETGQNLLEKHKNQGGKGMAKIFTGIPHKEFMEKLLTGQINPSNTSLKNIKGRLIDEGYLENKCAECGYDQKRFVDDKVPLILNFIDDDKKNYKMENLKLMCYNCCFLYAESPISEEEIEKDEHYMDNFEGSTAPDFELDDYVLEHFKDIGIFDDDDEDSLSFLK